MVRWGATPEAWMHFDLVLGLGEDLLPVVSNPEAAISPKSRMKALGKTPSLYNRQGQATGIRDWTEKKATGREIEQWAKEGDYGLCVQTRLVRALDIDVPDARIADQIREAFEDVVLRELPIRIRAGTGKQLAVFRLAGEIGKRSFRVAGGLVEFLATGQQFIAEGTHADGTRYAWAYGRPDEIPELTAEVFEEAWAAIVAQFAVEAPRESRRREAGAGGDLDVADDVAAWLVEHWPTFGTQGGKLFVECPWKAGHSMDSGETEAAWLLAGTKGYAQGHFECLHASCQGRADVEFLDAVGYRAADFEALPEAPAAVRDRPLPGFRRDKAGRIEAELENVIRAVSHPMCGFDIAFDTFRGALMVGPPGMQRWRPMTDTDLTRLRRHLQGKGFKPIAHEMMRQVVDLVGDDNRFDTAQRWLEALAPWDGVERAEFFFPAYFGVVDSPYARACGLYAWTAQAARVMDPGAKADMIPVLVGEQGQLKSWGLKAIAPAPEFFAELTMEMKDDDLSRMIRGKMVGEIAELRGLNSRAADSIKAWVTKQYEEWTPKYKEFTTRFPRRLVCYGTTNEDEFLADDTGNRRWLPMRVTRAVDVAAIERDREQLWAEGLARWRDAGVAWAEAERLAKAEHGAYRIEDALTDKVRAWLDEEDLSGTTPRRRGNLRIAEVMEHVGFDARSINRSNEMRVGRILRAEGMTKTDARVEGKVVKVWCNDL